MVNSKKVQAFTLNEVLIVLVITSIVVAIAFSVLQLVTKQYNAINIRYEERTEVLKLQQRMFIDLDQSYNATWSSLEEQLIVYDHKESFVTYDIIGNVLMRDDDTLSTGISGATFFLKGDEVEDGTIDGFEIEFIESGREIGFFVCRDLSSLQKMNEVWD